MTSRVVVLTGASSGIGRAAALAFAARGDRLVLAARGAADLATVAAACGGDPLVVPTDVTRYADVDALAAAAVERFGRIDVWVDSAAVMAYGRFEDLPVNVFDRVVTTDLLGTANVARAALRRFREQGSGTLVLTSSLLAHVTVPYISAYVTAKWGLRGLIRTLRQELRDAPDIHLCTVAPGSVDTPIYTSAANYAGFVGRPPPPVDPPEKMAEAIVGLADKPRAEVSVGATNRLIEFGFVALPGVYDAIVGPLMRRFGLSGTATGPENGNVFASAHRAEGGPGRWGRAAVGAALGASAAAVTAAASLAVRHAGRR
ncbi:SDR family NAD(P)-dependent oxidoreductase [Jidongwangia harbinensis]|uniref:SDR family NAD(P)-dependent oxidoreductase n=1 Tax=Jidongwangia harbinensis TaxID=2878561 RepID=UPI001CD9F6E7|nr:SDR family NAD(P)-dependent oxidoreductase [Jidongwangia harbinensis]MCA2216135.1 SDR family NAD(P)-dependent oxidoreductase [Jidongwangia harbinensis]